MDSAYERIDQAAYEALGMIEVLLENDDLPRYAVDPAQAIVDKAKAATKDMRRDAA